MRCRRLLATLLAVPLTAAAQQQSASPAAEPSPPPAPPGAYVLHAYANLIELPALILSPGFRDLPPVPRESILLQLDSGPAFHPVQMHLEGDEPLALALVIDASDNPAHLLRNVSTAAAELAQHSLRAHDSLSVYALDCHLIHYTLPLSNSAQAVAAAVDEVLSSPNLHNGHSTPHCTSSLHLWDSLTVVDRALAHQPGRHVMLLLSDGVDHDSKTSWNDLRRFAGATSVAIFALRDPQQREDSYGVAEDPLGELCLGSGGLLQDLRVHELAGSLQRILAMVRGRYILEFPRPDNGTVGFHDVVVTVRHRLTFITSAGVQVPLPPAGLATDPTTVPAAPSPAVMGKRRPLGSQP